MSEGAESSHKGLDICFCGFNAKLRISWSPRNSGRRFYGCKFDKDRGTCEYFRWYDEDFSDQAKRTINGLLKRVKENDAKLARARKKWIFVFVVVFIAWKCLVVPLFCWRW
uniref:Uncharacterized protein LOC104228094 n=1 Tax=Nicotiana sylvestris TaxID=4096 RepID=A0A1U7WJG7_NICSY|nr:PREDICTED: uncharacterized protein LOC104228094 [Nicotiana sylvestris]